jgi:hypothetical protein
LNQSETIVIYVRFVIFSRRQLAGGCHHFCRQNTIKRLWSTPSLAIANITPSL